MRTADFAGDLPAGRCEHQWPQMSTGPFSFFADDFTGATDALEMLAAQGVRTVLFTRAPTPQMLAKYPGLRAFGVAGTTRAMAPDQMERALRPALEAMRETGAPLVHYKVCSTFDSSPTVGSIGRAAEIGLQVFGSAAVPVVAGAPSLGRYCIFGHLFAHCGADPQVYRIDRHPSMSRHPVTPMGESDLRLHLGRQTALPSGLLDFNALSGTYEDARRRFEERVAEGARLVLIDLLSRHELAQIGRLLVEKSAEHRFVIGSSGVEEALVAHWRDSGAIPPPPTLAPAGENGPLLVVCGSCSPVTGRQIRQAVADGFAEVVLSPDRLADNSVAERASTEAVRVVAEKLADGRDVVLHTQAEVPVAHAAGPDVIGRVLAQACRRILAEARPKRVLVAGGDTSGRVARALEIEAFEMTAPLVRGAPLCTATAPGSPADGVQFCFKGGQIGPDDFFLRVQRGLRS